MSNHWNEGYFTDVAYTHGYYNETNPVFQRFCLLLSGYEVRESASHQHCELGFGQGVSLAVHAAAQPGLFMGTDFNPAHAAHAQALVNAAGAEAQVFDDSFEQFLDRTEGALFDSISLHGIWTWVSRENHRVIAEFARQRLKPGGVLYISYNCFPGWSPAYPLRQLFALHDRFASTSPNADQRVDAALSFAHKLLEAEPAYAKAVPSLSQHLSQIAKQDKHYLAHEYFNQEWNCMYFTDVVDALAKAKLDFACKAAPLESVDSLNINPPGLEFLASIAHPLLREQARDYFVNQRFRKDLFLRGAQRLNPAVQKQRLLATRFVLLKPVNEVSLKIPCALGEAVLQETTYRPLLEALAAEQYTPKTLQQLCPVLPDTSLSQLIEAVTILVGARALAPCQSEAQTQQVQERCAALNRHLNERALTSPDIATLASPVTGGGIDVGRFPKMFLHARAQGLETPADWARIAWQALAAQGQTLTKEGEPIVGNEASVAELTRIATEFAERRLPVLRALQIA